MFGECKLKKAEIYNEDNTYYLNVIYIRDTDTMISEINVPRILLPLDKTNCLINIDRYNIDILGRPIDNVTFRLYNGIALPVYKATGNVYFTEKILEYKTKEMTLSEIEKKLGYKIKILSEENKK